MTSYESRSLYSSATLTRNSQAGLVVWPRDPARIVSKTESKKVSRRSPEKEVGCKCKGDGWSSLFPVARDLNGGLCHPVVPM